MRTDFAILVRCVSCEHLKLHSPESSTARYECARGEWEIHPLFSGRRRGAEDSVSPLTPHPCPSFKPTRSP